MESSFICELKKVTKNIDFTKSFKELLSIRCGGDILVYFYPIYIKELIDVLRLVKKYNIKYIILGNGTNTLCSDKYFNGIVITLKRFHIKYIEFDDNLFLFSCFNLSSLIHFKYYKYFNKLSYIPGCVGGALMTNPSFMNESFYDIVINVLVYDINIDRFRLINKSNIDYKYRYTNLNKDYVVIGCLVKKERTSEVYQRYDKVTNKIKKPNSGSIFKNTSNTKAWELIKDISERCINKCYISNHHNNIIVNEGSSASDVYKLIDSIKKEVKKMTNIDLELEIHLKNF